jgi:hypothetical protein
MNKNDRDSNNKGHNHLLNQIKKKFQELKERGFELKNYLSQLNLDELSALTQEIGTHASKVYFSISMIVAELIRRAKINNDEFDIKFDNNKKGKITVYGSMSEQEEREVSARIGEMIKDGRIVNIIQHSPPKNTNSDLYTEVEKFQQELDRLKGK